ncbi:integrase [Zhongshania marina]|uniref:Integrase n=1 Tax=Zhongshania marina TaxID=2304603 RepID=A0A2S4HGY3_9GAMM|nr:integrase [Marortus luteolus]
MEATQEITVSRKVKINNTFLKSLDSEDGKQVVYWDDAQKGFGVRVNPGRVVDGVREPACTFFIQDRLKGQTIKATIGKYPTFSAEAARKVAKLWLLKIASGEDPRIQKVEGSVGATFGNMMLGYCEWMESEGKVSAAKVKRAIKKDIETAYPRLWKKPANQITPDDCDRIIEAIESEGKKRQADKIRAYMKTAFRKAINARGKRRYPEGLRIADIKINPCADIEKVEGSSNARDRALSVAEFRAYWKHAKAFPEPRRSIMMLHVLSGGQRIDQLRRITLPDIDRDSATATMLDYKGRRTTPYKHVFPLLPEALTAIDNLAGSGLYVFSCNGGISPVSDTYIRNGVIMIRKAMEAAEELENGHFTPGSIRATIETRLTASPYRVPENVLGHLLSHGLGGVQAKHYQKYKFHDEKLEALQMLLSMLEGKEQTGKVIPINGQAAQ